MTTRGRTTASDSGQVSSWLIKLILGVAIGGTIVLEFGAVGINRLQAGDIASTAASEAGITYSVSNSRDSAEERAEEEVERNGAELIGFNVSLERDEVSVSLRKRASTRLIHRITALEGLVTVEVTETVPIRK